MSARQARGKARRSIEHAQKEGFFAGLVRRYAPEWSRYTQPKKRATADKEAPNGR